MAISNAQGPGQIYSVGTDGKVQQWTKASAAPGMDTSGFSEQKIVRWKSFDGTAISGLMTPPPKKFTGKRPVLKAKVQRWLAQCDEVVAFSQANRHDGGAGADRSALVHEVAVRHVAGDLEELRVDDPADRGGGRARGEQVVIVGLFKQ
mgnify:CR=1 FL=1